jgi:MFS family permease
MRTQRLSLVAAIASIAVFGIGVGQSAPLLSLLLETRGTDIALNGINAAAAFAGVIVGPWIAPAAVRHVRITTFLLLCFALDITLFLSLKAFDGIGFWFVLRFLLGLVGANIFTVSEAWINRLAAGERRGQIVGLYAGTLAAGFAIGPLILSITGVRGWGPFIANACITAAAALPLLAVGRRATEFATQQPATLRSIVARAPLIMSAVALFGLYESALVTLLPVWGVRIGLSERVAAATVSGVYFGALALQVPLGMASDKLSRRTALRLCGIIGLLGAAFLPALSTTHLPLFVLLFLWGGIAFGIYPIALSMAGDRFHDAELVAVNAALISAYGLGALAGPALGGIAMDAWNPHGLPALFVALFAGFTLAIGRRSPT